MEDLNKPYGLAWQGDHILATDQDGIWRVPHILGALRAEDGALLVADDTGGTIWRITYTGSSEGRHAPSPQTTGSAGQNR